jgi:O-antigen ligase
VTASLPIRSRTYRALPLAVAGVIVLLPVGGTTVPVAGFALTLVAMAVPALMALVVLVRNEAPLPPSVVLLGLGLSAAGGVVSAALGVDPDKSVDLVIISLLTLGYGVAIGLSHRPGLEVVGPDLLVVVGGVVAAMALGSAGSLQAVEAGNVIAGRLTGPFAQPNELGLFCAALLPVAVACLVTTRERRRAVVLGVATACLAAAWVMSMSRGAWIGGLVALVALAVAEPTMRRALGAAGAAVAGTCAAALVLPTGVPVIGVLGERIRSLGDPTQNQYDDRPLIWGEAWRQATEHPWWGIGPGGFTRAASDAVSRVSAEPADHPHDLPLTILAERGVVGLGLAGVVVAGVALAAARWLRSGPRSGDDAARRTRSLAVVAGLAAVMVHGAFDMPLRNPIVCGLVWTLLGAAVVVETSSARRAPSPESEPVTC